MAVFSPELSPYNAPNYDVFSAARVRDPLGVVLGAPLDGAQSYTPWIGLSTIRELALKHADKVGLVDREQLEDVERSAIEYRAEVLELRARVEELEAQQDRIAGLVADGFTIVKKQGRPARKDS